MGFRRVLGSVLVTAFVIVQTTFAAPKSTVVKKVYFQTVNTKTISVANKAAVDIGDLPNSLFLQVVLKKSFVKAKLNFAGKKASINKSGGIWLGNKSLYKPGKYTLQIKGFKKTKNKHLSAVVQYLDIILFDNVGPPPQFSPTPSATPSPQVTPTPAVSPTPIFTPSPSPSPSATPTVTPTIDPSPTPSLELKDSKVQIESVNLQYKYEVSDSYKSTNIKSLTKDSKQANSIEARFSKYGGDIKRKVNGTGSFRIAKIKDDLGEYYSFIDPEGYLYYDRALGRVWHSIHESLANPKFDNTQEFNDVYGTKEVWADQVAQTFKQIGISSLGNWSSLKIFRSVETKYRPNYWVNLDVLGKFAEENGWSVMGVGNDSFVNYKGVDGVLPLFNPEIPTFGEDIIKKKFDNNEIANEPYLLAYFSGNEQKPWSESLLNKYLQVGKKDPQDPNFLAAKQWLKANNYSVSSPPTAANKKFLTYAMKYYYSMLRAIVDKYTPGKLIASPRLYGSQLFDSTIECAAKAFDLLAINYYPDPHLLSSFMGNIKAADAPFIVSEIYSKGDDTPNNLGLKNTIGAGPIVKTQSDRGLFYANMNIELLSSRYGVGHHHHKYMDPIPELSEDNPIGDDSNKGFVNMFYEPYKPLIEKAQQLDLLVYEIREKLLKK